MNNQDTCEKTGSGSPLPTPISCVPGTARDLKSEKMIVQTQISSSSLNPSQTKAKGIATGKARPATGGPKEAARGKRVSQTHGATNRKRIRRAKAGTTPQHRKKSLIRRMVRLVDPMLVCEQITGSPREIPDAVPVFGRDWAERKQGRRAGEVSRGHIKRWKRAGSSRRRVTRPTKNQPEVSPRERPERCPCRTVRVNEKGK